MIFFKFRNQVPGSRPFVAQSVIYTDPNEKSKYGSFDSSGSQYAGRGPCYKRMIINSIDQYGYKFKFTDKENDYKYLIKLLFNVSDMS